jgi:hypothetical protein
MPAEEGVMNTRWLRAPIVGALVLMGTLAGTGVAQAASPDGVRISYRSSDRYEGTRIVYRNGHRVRVRVIYERPYRYHHRYQRYYWYDRHHYRHYGYR